MARAAVSNFAKMNLKPTMRISSVSANKQFDYDSREVRAVYFDKAYVGVVWKSERLIWKKIRKWRQVTQDRQSLRYLAKNHFHRSAKRSTEIQ